MNGPPSKDPESPVPEIGDQAGAKRGRTKSYGRTAKKGALWSVVRQGGHELIAIPMSMIMARLLTPNDFGITVAATFFVLLAARISQFGFSAALVRIKELRPEHTSSVFVVNLAAGIAAYIGLVAAAPAIGQFFRSPEAGALLPVAALTFLFSPFSAIATALMSRRMQFNYLAFCDWTDSLVGAVVTVGLAFAGFSYWSIPYGHLTAIIARVTLQIWLVRWRPSLRFSRAAMGELLSFGVGVHMKRLLEYAAFNLDTLVVGRILGTASLGLYDKAFSTMNRFVNRLTLGQAAFRIFAIIHEDPVRFQRAYSRLILSVTLLGYPAFAACIVMAEPLFVVLYGETWLPAVVPFQVLCVGGMLKLLNAYGSQANEAAGGIWAQVRRQAIGAVLVVVGAAVGSIYGGITGAAVGVSLAMVLLTASMQALVRRITGLSWRAMIAPQVPAVTCAVAVSLVIVAMDTVLFAALPNPPALLRLMVDTATALVFFLCFVIFSPFAEVRDVVRETVDDLAPASAVLAFNRLSRLGRASNVP